MTVISMKQWLGANERSRLLPTDKWYLDFTNKILPLVAQSTMFANENDRSKMEAAITISLYFQDAIAQSGGWKIFSDLFYKLYRSYLPFYNLTDEYIADEVNQEDIAFVLWTLKSHPATWDEDNYTLFSPYDKELLTLSQSLYEIINANFEEAPINEEPSSPLWVMGPDLLEIPLVPLPEITSETKLKKDAELSLEYSKGWPLLYFATYSELKTFFIDVLKWENNPSALLKDLENEKEFVAYANAKGLLIAHNVAAYFCDEHNPMYDAERAATEGYKIFCHFGACPFDLIKYGMTKELLPDLQLPFPGGKEILQNNWDFIARYYLCEYYEGE